MSKKKHKKPGNSDFNEQFNRLSDDQVISTARAWLVNLTANNNEDARKMGMSDEQIEGFRQSIAKMEKAVEDEKKAIWARDKDRVTDAAEILLKKLGPSSKPFVFHPPKPPGDSDRN